MNIETISDFRALYRTAGYYSSVGGYPLFYLTADGEALCFDCLKAERRSILEAIHNGDATSGWLVVGVEANWEDPDLHCGHCSARIESAYAEEESRCTRYACAPLSKRHTTKRNETHHNPR